MAEADLEPNESCPTNIHIHILTLSFFSMVEIALRKIVPFKSLRNFKGYNKGNFISKSNSNKIMLCGGGGQQYFVLSMISTL